MFGQGSKAEGFEDYKIALTSTSSNTTKSNVFKMVIFLMSCYILFYTAIQAAWGQIDPKEHRCASNALDFKFGNVTISDTAFTGMPLETYKEYAQGLLDVIDAYILAGGIISEIDGFEYLDLSALQGKDGAFLDRQSVV